MAGCVWLRWSSLNSCDNLWYGREYDFMDCDWWIVGCVRTNWHYKQWTSDVFEAESVIRNIKLVMCVIRNWWTHVCISFNFHYFWWKCIGVNHVEHSREKWVLCTQLYMCIAHKMAVRRDASVCASQRVCFWVCVRECVSAEKSWSVLGSSLLTWLPLYVRAPIRIFIQISRERTFLHVWENRWKPKIQKKFAWQKLIRGKSAIHFECPHFFNFSFFVISWIHLLVFFLSCSFISTVRWLRIQFVKISLSNTLLSNASNQFQSNSSAKIFLFSCFLSSLSKEKTRQLTYASESSWALIFDSFFSLHSLILGQLFKVHCTAKLLL